MTTRRGLRQRRSDLTTSSLTRWKSSSFSRSKSSLKETGFYLSVRSSTSERTENLIFLKELIEVGKIRSVIVQKMLSVGKIWLDEQVRRRRTQKRKCSHNCCSIMKEQYGNMLMGLAPKKVVKLASSARLKSLKILRQEETGMADSGPCLQMQSHSGLLGGAAWMIAGIAFGATAAACYPSCGSGVAVTGSACRPTSLS